MPFSVPVVDISAYVRGGTAPERAEVALAIDEACRRVGFVQIVGHGVPEEAIAGLAAALDEFFLQPLEAKQAYRTPPSMNRGYTAPKSESLSLSLGVESANRMNDFFEAFNVGDATSDHPGLDLPESIYSENVWPDEIAPGFRAGVEAYYREAARVARTMVRIFADALGLPHDFFDAYTSHSIDVLRMNNYALPEGTDVTLDGDLTGMGEHTDFGIVTILWADRVAGLQVLATDGTWHDVQPEPGALLINLGDLTGRWTNDQWMSTLHRVKPPVIDGRIERRRSAAFFHDGNWDAIVSTLPGSIDAEHPDRYEPVTVEEHISAKLQGSRAGVRNVAAGGERDRVVESRGY